MADFDTLWISINVVPLCCIVHILTTFPSFHYETLAYKKPMDVYQESIKLNQEKAKAS
jgi:hypothetical protein